MSGSQVDIFFQVFAPSLHIDQVRSLRSQTMDDFVDHSYFAYGVIDRWQIFRKKIGILPRIKTSELLLRRLWRTVLPLLPAAMIKINCIVSVRGS